MSHPGMGGTRPKAAFTSQMPVNSSDSSSPSANTPSGTTSSATSSFDSTVWSSDTGRDFQNRMLRSLRSVYRQSSR